MSERCAYETIRWIKEFALPGKKALLKSDNEFEVILIDAVESPIEHPKKNKENSILGKRKSTQ